jgi:hypothetical protein
MSQSDYLEIKKRKNMSLLSNRTSGYRTKNLQFLNIQTIPIVNEDNELTEVDRFSVKISGDQDLAMVSNNLSNFEPMFSIPRIHVPEYIKNRYVPPFCWSCPSVIDISDVIHKIQCTACEQLYNMGQCNACEQIYNITQEHSLFPNINNL